MTVRTTLTTAATLALLLLLAGLTPAGATDPAAAIRAQAREVQRLHRAQGMAGLELASRNCREEKGGFRRVYLDVAAETLDREFAEAMGIGGYPYFEGEVLMKRMAPVFTSAKWDMDTTNGYLQFVDAVVRGEFEH